MLSAFCFLPGAESISRQAFCRRVSAFCFLPYRKQIARLGHEKAESFLLSARCNQRKQRPCFLPDICLQISGRENGVIDIFLLSAFCFLLKRSLGRENGVIDIFLLSAFCFLLSVQLGVAHAQSELNSSWENELNSEFNTVQLRVQHCSTQSATLLNSEFNSSSNSEFNTARASCNSCLTRCSTSVESYA